MPATLSMVEEAPARAGQPAFAPSINDLAIRVGTVNGSGSQSANLVILRALYAMGIPCSGKNVFPSNIEGLPTWFHIRASAKGYIGHVLDPQVLVCMNEPTVKDDVRQLKPGAICIYRDDIDLDPTQLRDDVRFFSVPFRKLVEKAYPPDKSDKGYGDKLRKVINMVYVGVLASACKIEMEAVEGAIRREFPGRKAKAAEINISAVRTGFEWAEENLPADLPFQVQRMADAPEKILIEGNKAAALGVTVRRGQRADLVPDHPLEQPGGIRRGVPQEAPGRPGRQADLRRRPGRGRAGGRRHGHRRRLGRRRALTATAGPGISLMSEFVGLAYFAEIPVVIVDVQRMGPSTGLPTRTSQGDILKLHLLGHGDCRHIVLIPGSVEECYSMTIEALDLAQQFQTPVFVATDLDLGMNLWLSDPFPYPTKPIQRGKVLSAADLERLGQFERYRDVDGDGVCYRTIPGHRAPAGGLLHAGHRPQREVGIQRAARGLEEEPRPAGAQARDRPASPAGAGDRRRARAPGSACSPTAARTGRSSRPATSSATGRADRATAASAPCRSPTRSSASSSGTRGSTSSSRTATARSRPS